MAPRGIGGAYVVELRPARQRLTGTAFICQQLWPVRDVTGDACPTQPALAKGYLFTIPSWKSSDLILFLWV